MFKLWINDVRTNGFRVQVTDENGKESTYKYFSTKDDPDAEKKAKALAKKHRGIVEPAMVVLGNVDELDRDLGSLRVPLELFVDQESGEMVQPVKHELHAFDAKDIYFDEDPDTGDRLTDYLKAEDFVYGHREDVRKAARRSVL